VFQDGRFQQRLDYLGNKIQPQSDAGVYGLNMRAACAGKVWSGLMRQAVEFAGRIPQRVILIDGTILTELMIEHRLSVLLGRMLEFKHLYEDFIFRRMPGDEAVRPTG